MVKRVSKVRKSAILEHLLDLERQIRAELARASMERKNSAGADGRLSRARSESLASDSDGTIVSNVAQRYLH